MGELEYIEVLQQRAGRKNNVAEKAILIPCWELFL